MIAKIESGKMDMNEMSSSGKAAVICKRRIARADAWCWVVTVSWQVSLVVAAQAGALQIRNPRGQARSPAQFRLNSPILKIDAPSIFMMPVQNEIPVQIPVDVDMTWLPQKWWPLRLRYAPGAIF